MPCELYRQISLCERQKRSLAYLFQLFALTEKLTITKFQVNNMRKRNPFTNKEK